MATENPFVKLFSIDFKDHVEVKKSGNTHEGMCVDCYKATRLNVA